MKNPEHTPAEPSHPKERRRLEHQAERRFTNAWREIEAIRDQAPSRETPLRRLRRFTNTRSGRIVMLAPLGAIGAYFLFRRKR